ncbi:MAG: YciI family protein [Geminicoccaceae bacterium]
MEYLLLIYGDEKARGSLTPAETGQMYAAYGAYTQALIDAGALRGGNELKPTSAATSVRLVGGKPQVLDGPYAETKEQLGGYYLIDVPDLDAAIAWAARCPGAQHGTMEVRPVNPHG